MGIRGTFGGHRVVMGWASGRVFSFDGAQDEASRRSVPSPRGARKAGVSKGKKDGPPQDEAKPRRRPPTITPQRRRTVLVPPGPGERLHAVPGAGGSRGLYVFTMSKSIVR